MSRLLYAEPRSTYLQRKSTFLGGSIAVVVVNFLVTIVYPISSALYAGEGLQNTVLPVLVGTFLTVFFVLGFLFPSMSMQRFAIYNDRIALPRPRRFSLLRRKPDTIMKSEIQSAEFGYETEYETTGLWCCTFTFKNAETHYLNWFQVQCKAECVPALREFLKGLDNA